MLSRRQLLAAPPALLASPLLLTLSSCSKPAVLDPPPVPSRQTDVLLAAVTAEQNLLWLYDKAGAAYPAIAATLAPLRAEHAAHLAQLRATVVEPPGKTVPSTVTSKPPLGATQDKALAQLSAAETGAVAAQMGRLTGAPAALAQLYASIAASEATHIAVLNAKIGGK
jgi:hypothetical protein